MFWAPPSSGRGAFPQSLRRTSQALEVAEETEVAPQTGTLITSRQLDSLSLSARAGHPQPFAKYWLGWATRALVLSKADEHRALLYFLHAPFIPA
jgi:hypothetical protein